MPAKTVFVNRALRAAINKRVWQLSRAGTIGDWVEQLLFALVQEMQQARTTNLEQREAVERVRFDELLRRFGLSALDDPVTVQWTALPGSE